jgi:CheY-like chemotaxis protein
MSTAARIPALVVDDTPLNLKLVAAILRANNFEVTTAASAEDAQHLLETARFRLLLLDLRLPGMDGLAFARALRGAPQHEAMRIVAVTANAMKSDEADALAAGCDAFIAKPINTRTFVPTLLGILERAR